ncbi:MULTISPECIES: aldehyde dehydrogenase family protein [Hyphomicrobiales]|uniref:Aldehyde dehydrogenase family protein n=4 Tax=Hyphomicrobiales TaxID=356 RepID=A0A256GD62_9HYPH|nr:aldehyde dehydrogenase family protein [Brucella lupini]MCD4659583.1 aldehyde dehydrogenase family protein [Agrobacterium sp.]QCM13569.1 aldehyde dehydrogenase family protein [Agrobacterium tumefaciens]QIX20002.1 aldehyde dehydrogenase family protein [Agrobacterium pusense]CAD7029828.1 aldehyde dehydrogenase [Rhizobium sp. P007]CUX04019.1 Aldehyde dehydrogenase PuuC [Agrobacterium genomosp. 2 str. CFBP 5494]
MSLNQSTIDALRYLPAPMGLNFIDNQAVAAANGEEMPIISPIDGKQLTVLAASGSEDVNRAVAAARRSFEAGHWSRMAPKDRKKILLRWADLIDRHALEIAVLGARDNGTEIRMALKGDPQSAADTIRFYAEAIDKRNGEITPTRDDVLSLISREPVGVVGVIIPWNFPLMIGSWKLAPALAAGNSVVVKPSEEASLSILRVIQLATEAGMPPGVLNAINGRGAVVGQALGLHMDVDVLAFTGSGAVGRLLLEYSARSNLKRVYLELGGKSPNLVFADAPDLARAAKETAASIFRNNGQVCVAASRLAIERSIYKDFMNAVRAEAEAMRIGDPLSLAFTTGALANAAQLAKTKTAIAQATQQGAVVYHGGHQLHAESGGFYHEPTILTDVTANMDVVQEEIFGPVLAARSFDTEDDAIAIANETVFGLSSVLWTRDLSRAHLVSSRIKSGVVQINCYSGADITAPLGGVRQSGNGSDRSLHAFDKYENLKAKWIQL